MFDVIQPPPVLKGTPFKWHECLDCGKKFLAVPPNCLLWIKCPDCGSSDVEVYENPLDTIVRW